MRGRRARWEEHWRVLACELWPPGGAWSVGPRKRAVKPRNRAYTPIWVGAAAKKKDSRKRSRKPVDVASDDSDGDDDVEESESD